MWSPSSSPIPSRQTRTSTEARSATLRPEPRAVRRLWACGLPIEGHRALAQEPRPRSKVVVDTHHSVCAKGNGCNGTSHDHERELELCGGWIYFRRMPFKRIVGTIDDERS